ncbi:helix-turn-helix domain-containing protein [Intestinimonas sp. HCP28S3_D6]|uniref:helix-turn-helix domain-containing protein n=1 Tax=Intestinimonas sp. HCP28S3_D6 TaxID=3438942 RepID=UPI003F8AD3F7
MEPLTTFAARLRALRRQKKQTQKDMAALLGCTVSNYQKMEYGQVNIPITTLMALADYFSVSTDYLLGRAEGELREK